jgi:hypothetical protein
VCEQEVTKLENNQIQRHIDRYKAVIKEINNPNDKDQAIEEAVENKNIII